MIQVNVLCEHFRTVMVRDSVHLPTRVECNSFVKEPKHNKHS